MQLGSHLQSRRWSLRRRLKDKNKTLRLTNSFELLRMPHEWMLRRTILAPAEAGPAEAMARPGLYLETDKSENVRFYQKFGFTVVAQAEILGVANWFMSRPDENSG